MKNITRPTHDILNMCITKHFESAIIYTHTIFLLKNATSHYIFRSDHSNELCTETSHRSPKKKQNNLTITTIPYSARGDYHLRK